MLDFIFQNIPNQIISISSIISTIVGGGITLIGVYLTNHFNKDRANEDKHENEIATILSIVEELKCLSYAFRDELDEHFSNINEEKYINYPITITQDYTTIYTSNADNIGTIKDCILRNKIIKTYTLIKKLIENILHYNPQIEKLISSRFTFIKRMYANDVYNECCQDDMDKEIKKIKNNVNNDIWNWTVFKGLNQNQIINFLRADDNQESNLKYWSGHLKNIYTEIKDLITDIIELSEEEYLKE